MAQDPADPMPSPPFPDPDSALLRIVVENAIREYQTGAASAEQAILHAAVHGWYEGHIEGEDVCPGCTYRGSDSIPRPGSAELN